MPISSFELGSLDESYPTQLLLTSKAGTETSKMADTLQLKSQDLASPAAVPKVQQLQVKDQPLQQRVALDIKNASSPPQPKQPLQVDSSELLNNDLRQDLKLMEVIHSGSLNEQQIRELAEFIRVKDNINWIDCGTSSDRRIIPLDQNSLEQDKKRLILQKYAHIADNINNEVPSAEAKPQFS